MCILLFSLSVFTTYLFFFFFSSRRRHTRLQGDWSSDVCSSDLIAQAAKLRPIADIAAELGLAEDEVELYGKYKAKVRLGALAQRKPRGDRKSTRLNSSHLVISYAVFCLKKKKKIKRTECDIHIRQV